MYVGSHWIPVCVVKDRTAQVPPSPTSISILLQEHAVLSISVNVVAMLTILILWTNVKASAWIVNARKVCILLYNYLFLNFVFSKIGTGLRAGPALSTCSSAALLGGDNLPQMFTAAPPITDQCPSHYQCVQPRYGVSPICCTAPGICNKNYFL